MWVEYVSWELYVCDNLFLHVTWSPFRPLSGVRVAASHRLVTEDQQPHCQGSPGRPWFLVVWNMCHGPCLKTGIDTETWSFFDGKLQTTKQYSCYVLLCGVLSWWTLSEIWPSELPGPSCANSCGGHWLPPFQAWIVATNWSEILPKSIQINGSKNWRISKKNMGHVPESMFLCCPENQWLFDVCCPNSMVLVWNDTMI